MSSEKQKYLSSEGFERIKKELIELRVERRKEIAERLEYAKSLGDLTENSEYQEAKEEQLKNEARIAELEILLAKAVLISKSSNQSIISLGSTIIVKRENSDNPPEEYVIVGSEEADPKGKKISNESPLGRAFLGRKKGDVVLVAAPKGQLAYHILWVI